MMTKILRSTRTADKAAPKASTEEDKDKKVAPAAVEPEEDDEDETASEDEDETVAETDVEEDDEDEDEEVPPAVARVQAILDSPEAVGREGLAKRLAFKELGLSAKRAIALLATAPKAETTAKADASGFKAALRAQNPKIAPSAPKADVTPEAAAVNELLAAAQGLGLAAKKA